MNMQTKITTATATLAQLKPGAEYPGGNINARLHYTDAEIEELAASLKGPDGQLRPLLVATHSKKPGTFYVFGGGRRRLAFERLIGRGDLPKDHPIEIVSHGELTPKEALSKSLADNQSVQMHPADQAVTFATLAQDQDPTEIAKARGMTLRAVNQSIALGQELIPEVLSAWRAGKIDRNEVEDLVLASPQQQKDAIKELQTDGSINTNQLRTAIMQGKEELMTRLVGFVGVSDIRAAGLKVTEDFFGSGGVVQDLRGLEKLASKKMAGLVKAEEAAGWSWVDGKTSEARRMHHGYGEAKAKPEYTPDEKKRLAEIDAQLKVLGALPVLNDDEDKQERALEREREDLETVAKARAYTAKQKAAAGVMIRLRADGTVDYTRGLIKKTGAKKKAQRQGGAPAYAEREPEPLSWEARRALQDWQNEAAADLLSKHPKEAFTAMLASILTGDYSGAISIENLTSYNKPKGAKPFDANYSELSKLSLDKQVAKIGPAILDCVDVAGHGGKRKPSFSTIERVVSQKEMAAALAKNFNPKVYFTGASKKHMLGVVAEAFGPAKRKEAEGHNEELTRKELIANIGKTGWLPPELRTKLYVAPKPVAAAADADAKSKAAKKKAKR